MEIRDLKVFEGGLRILEVPYFRVKEKECLVLFGPNGAGKSTFLKVASLLQKPDSGRIFYHDTEVNDKNRDEIRKKIACLLQKPVFFRGTVRENLLLGLKFRRVETSEQKKRLEKISCLFNLKPLLERSPQQLSGGEKQRVHLARAFILEPEFLFLDEPFNGLDVSLKENLLQDFVRIRREMNITTILVTHNRDEAAFLSDRVAVMISGQIVQTGRLEEIISNPATPEVSRLMGQEILVEGLVEDSDNGLLRISAHGQVVFAFGPYKKGEKVILTFRPEEVILARQKPATSVRNWFYGLVYDLKLLDRLAVVGVDCGFRIKALVSKVSVEELELKPGKNIWAGIKASALGTWSPSGSVDILNQREVNDG
jgi:molybdopterin-binding protein